MFFYSIFCYLVMTRVQTLLWQVSLGAFSGHVVYSLLSRREEEWVFWGVAFVAAVLAFASNVAPTVAEWRATNLHILLVVGSIAWVLDVLGAFGIAYTACILVLVWIHLAHSRDLVRYDPRTADFVVTRSTTFAALYAILVYAERSISYWYLLRFVPFLVGTVETVGMLVLGTSSYTFTSLQFVEYTMLKSVVLVGVPQLCRTLERGPPWRAYL